MPLRSRVPATRRAASAPPAVGTLQHVVGASANYAGHPTITDGTLQQNLAYYETQLQAALGVSGLVLAGPHGYSGNSWPATWAQSSVAFATSVGYGYSFLNTKTGGSPTYSTWANWAAGGWNAHCATFVNSVPDGHTCVFTTNHEGENDKGGGYGGPDDDGGAFEATYADQHARGTAQMANTVAQINRPNVWYAWVPMGATFPTSGNVGDPGIKGRDPLKWNPYKYMTPAARARTILAPDMYTKMTSAGGAFESFATKFGRIIDYAVEAGFGAGQYGLFEHTWNNDVGASDASLGAAWDATFAYLQSLGNLLGCYLQFNTSDTAGASGVDGWVDGPQQYLHFGTGARTLNTGAPGGGGIAFRAYASNSKNDALPTLTIPATAQVDDTAYVQHVCTASITVGNLTQSGWTLIGTQQTSNNAKATVWRKKLASGDIGQPVTPTMSGTSRWAMQVWVGDGIHLTTPEDVTPVFSTDNTTATTHTTAAITPTTAGAVVLQLAANRGTTVLGTLSWGQPTGYTLRGQQPSIGNPGGSLAAADRAWTSGAEGPVTWTSDAALGNWVGAAIALRPA